MARMSRNLSIIMAEVLKAKDLPVNKVEKYLNLVYNAGYRKGLKARKEEPKLLEYQEAE